MYAKLPDHILHDIKARISIVEVIGQYVDLKRAGRSHKGLCPFHKENAPSFTVSEESGFFYCFGCNEHGDTISFFQKMENLSFMEAVEQLAQRAGIELPEVKNMTREEKKKLSEKDRMFEANLLALEFFEKQLISHPKSKEVREYISKRGISKEMVERFRIGYAPDSWDELLKSLQKKGTTTHLLEKVGLVVTGKRGGYYDRFRNRLIFPIIMQQNHVVGFGGRTLGEEEQAKYINSPESSIFQKSDCFYGYNLARGTISKNGRAIIVEGNIDVVMMRQHGFEETVATLGTALTMSHVRFMKRMTENFFIVFDGDTAGKKAMFRSLDIFLKESVSARAVLLPKGHDPDSFVAENGSEAMQELLKKAPYLFDIWLDEKYTNMNVGPRGATECLHAIAPKLAKIHDPVERTLYAQKISGRLGIAQALVMQVLRQHTARGNWEKPARKTVVGKVKSPGLTKSEAAEQEVFSLLVHYPNLIAERFLNENIINKMKVDALRDLANTILDHLQRGESITPDLLIGLIDHKEWKNRIAKILLTEIAATEEKAIEAYEDCMRTLDITNIEGEIEEARKQLKEAASDNHELKEKLGNKLKKLFDELQKIKSAYN